MDIIASLVRLSSCCIAADETSEEKKHVEVISSLYDMLENASHTVSDAIEGSKIVMDADNKAASEKLSSLFSSIAYVLTNFIFEKGSSRRININGIVAFKNVFTGYLRQVNKLLNKASVSAFLKALLDDDRSGVLADIDDIFKNEASKYYLKNFFETLYNAYKDGDILGNAQSLSESDSGAKRVKDDFRQSFETADEMSEYLPDTLFGKYLKNYLMEEWYIKIKRSDELSDEEKTAMTKIDRMIWDAAYGYVNDYWKFNNSLLWLKRSNTINNFVSGRLFRGVMSRFPENSEIGSFCKVLKVLDKMLDNY